MVRTVAVTFGASARERAIVAEALDGDAEPVYLADLDDDDRSAALRAASAVLARNTGRELRAHEDALLEHIRLVQFVTAGVDFVPLSRLPPGVPVAANGGAYAEPMAEH